MHPTLPLFGNYAVNSYSLFTTLGAMLFAAVCYREALRLQFPIVTYWRLVFLVAVFAIIGSKIAFSLFFNTEKFFSSPVQTLLHTGWMIYGAVIGAYVALFVGRALFSFPLFTALDGMSYGAFLGLGFGRIGCYLAGCCYGTPTDSFLGVTFPGMDCAVHPTQLYETTACLLIFTGITFLRKKTDFPGMQFSIFTLSYGIFRFFVEFIRADRNLFGFYLFTPSQYISLGIIICMSILLYKFHHRHRSYGKERV